MQKCKELKKPQFNSVSLDFVRQKEKKIRPDCELISVMQLADVNAVTFKRKKKKNWLSVEEVEEAGAHCCNPAGARQTTNQSSRIS